nr:transposase [Bacillus subtilis]
MKTKYRPSLDPLILFKMMFIGYLYGIRSERQLEKEIYYNMAYRWFLGLNINDPVPHHSTISWNRRTRFKDTTIFQDIFDGIVLQVSSIMTWWADESYSPTPHTLKPMPTSINTQEKQLRRIPKTISRI